MTIELFRKKKSAGQKIHMLTAYDYWSARILNNSKIDALLVGDSVAMVMHGHDSTVSATTEMMRFHTEAVARGAKNKFIVTDMPFGTFRKSKDLAVETATQFLQAGAHAVKLEGLKGNEMIIEHLVDSGIPVMGHLGLTPQFVNQFGGYKVQGKTDEGAQQIFQDSKQLEQLGCFSVVLECVPTSLGTTISKELTIPSIGIGAGKDCDGQILVLQDMLGAQSEIQPKFVRRYADMEKTILESVDNYCKTVESQSFPQSEESYL